MVHHVKASDISSDTAQSEGLRRFAALSGKAVGAEKLWMGETHASPQTVSAHHHHGEAEIAIYVRSGHPQFVFHDGVEEALFIPPCLAHREENPDPKTPAEVVVARSTQEAIAADPPELYPLEGTR